MTDEAPTAAEGPVPTNHSRPGPGSPVRRGILLVLFGLGCAVVGGFVAQCMVPPTALERELAYHSPDGIVKSVSGEDRSRPEELRQILEAMQIQPGMDILDLGAGTGIFTFLFADLLDGTGSIHATDVEPDLIELLDEQVEASGYQNILPTLVGAEGLDPFYTQHSWDLIFLSGVYVYLPHRQDYFSELRASLRPNGRLFV
ncbi:MAG: methyltransferase domain-containing protein, partial [Myxococcota bacterium]|nr:methyltransferase domain-containing protein [Myxococcota bacterium]